MKTHLIAILAAVSSIIVTLPIASALDQRTNFGDDHYTFIYLGEPKVCGDHMCVPGEWEKLITTIMDYQIKKIANVTEQLAFLSSIPVPNNNKVTSAHAIADTSNGKITSTFAYKIGDGKFSTYLPVYYKGSLGINHITISQKNAGVNITSGWINQQWRTTITPNTVTFDSRDGALIYGQTLGIVIVTDGKPAFSLAALSSRPMH